MPGTRKLGRATANRTAMLRAMVTFLLENGKIETTVTRAKEVKAMTEKIITKAKENDLHSKRQVYSYVTKETVAKKVFDDICRHADTVVDDGDFDKIALLLGADGNDTAFETVLDGIIDEIADHFTDATAVSGDSW